jgi:hypothetical protein
MDGHEDEQTGHGNSATQIACEKGKHSYRIQVDKDHFVVEAQALTGREILELSGHTPAERFMLLQKLRGGETEKVELDQSVDLTHPGVERFLTIPLDQQEG